MTDNDQGDDYEVGYKKPPKNTRFEPGKSGNPKGRKKGRLDLGTILVRELNQKTNIREGDQVIRITKQALLIKSLVAKAIKGDRHAVSTVLTLMARLIGLESGAGQTMDQLREEDMQILEGLFQRAKEDGISEI